MKEHPILFSGPMVQAILEGRKTQTRRVVKQDYKPHPGQCTYGEPGDRLWVRENLDMWPGGPCYAVDGAYVDGFHVDWEWFNNFQRSYCPSIFMPRWASRITLEIVNIRVERLQEINNNDAMSEGAPDLRTIENNWDMRDCFRELWNSINAKRGYRWDLNPYVWVIEFKVI